MFKGERRKGRSGEIALDNVSIHRGECSNRGWDWHTHTPELWIITEVTSSLEFNTRPLYAVTMDPTRHCGVLSWGYYGMETFTVKWLFHYMQKTNCFKHEKNIMCTGNQWWDQSEGWKPSTYMTCKYIFYSCTTLCLANKRGGGVSFSALAKHLHWF